MPEPEKEPQKSDDVFAEEWGRFIERLGAADERILKDLEACWQDLRSIAEPLLAAAPAAEAPALTEPSLETFQQARSEAASLLLHEPGGKWNRKRPFKRAWMALEAYERAVDGLVFSVPDTLPLSGAQALHVLAEHGPDGFWKRWTRFRRKPRIFPLKRLIASQLQRRSLDRSEVEGRFFVILGRAVRQLRSAWEIRRAVLDGEVMGRPLPGKSIREKGEKERRSLAQILQTGEAALAELRAESQRAVRDIAGRLLSLTAWPRNVRDFSAREERAAALAHRSQEWRTVEWEIQLEIDVERCEDEILSFFRRTLETLHQELEALLVELDGVIEWLRRKIEQDSDDEFPPPKADVVPAPSRVFEIETSVKALLRNLPEAYQSISELSVTPHRKPRSRLLNPRATYVEAFLRSGRGDLAAVLEEIEAEHRKLVQEIERARQVVAFGIETAGVDEGAGSTVMKEALQNAFSLLEFYRGERPDWRHWADRRIVRNLAAVFSEGRLILTRHRLGALAYLAEQGARRGLVIASRSAAKSLGRLVARTYRYLEIVVVRFLVYIGWKSAPAAGRVDVVTRPYLPAEFTVDLELKELPALYRRLFRFEPVQDPRFLVGREHEMAAIVEARSFWKSGRPVAVIVVGQRGSGKTSLINCAVKRYLEDLEMVRAEFGRRLTDEAEMRAWIAELTGAPDPAALEEFLSKQSRIIVLEELERTFLRQVGRFGAIRGLQRLIAATCSSTLWILGTNQVAFQFLDAAVEFGSTFSHRIYAGTASRDDLRRAILLRHNLSGLRLKFADPQLPRTALQRMKLVLRREDDPDSEFFDALSRECAGIYRSAFDIWLGQIEAAHGGVLHMKPLQVPDLSPVIDDLDMDDLFTLVAVMQHGSLTPEEHAVIFRTSTANSRAQIDELWTREIVEPDPKRDGYRIRPEAMRVVKEALYRRNLL